MRRDALERRAEVEELQRQLAKLEVAKKDADSAEIRAQVCTPLPFHIFKQFDECSISAVLDIYGLMRLNSSLHVHLIILAV